MIRDVQLSVPEKVLAKLPKQIEPLMGKRAGQRSIRLSKSFRAFYRIVDGAIEFIDVFDVNHHEY